MKVSKFATAIIAGSIALTSFASAPVYAASEGEKLTRFLLGAIAVGAIVHSVNKNKRKHSRATKHDNYQHHQSTKVYNNHRPKTCLRKKYTNQGWKTFYSKKCLDLHRAKSRDQHARKKHQHNHKSDLQRNHRDHNKYDHYSTRSNRYYRYVR